MSAPLPALPPPRRSRGESMTVGQALERAEELRPGCKVDSCTRQRWLCEEDGMLRALLFSGCGLRAGVGADLAWPAEGGLDDAVELLLVHHAAAEDDAARRVHEHEVRAHLPQIIPLERPHLIVVRELGRALSPARGDGGAGGEALETARVARADAASLLGGTGPYQHVAGLGVQHAVKEPARAHDARAHAGADGHVDGVLEPLAAAVDHFAEAGNVHVRVIGHRNPEGVGERGIPHPADGQQRDGRAERRRLGHARQATAGAATPRRAARRRRPGSRRWCRRSARRRCPRARRPA